MLALSNNPKEKAYLLHNEHVFTLEQINTLGSDAVCNIWLGFKKIESRHARIEYKNNKYYLKDALSRTGVYLNNTKIIEAELQNGDILKLGKTEFIFSHTPIRLKKNKALTSKNVTWQNHLASLDLIAQNTFPVILIGKSGTGKDVIARQIHELSHRNHEAFVSVNCSALSPQLVESELFGHIKGSFTGAESNRAGAFIAANNGTLFLDEIGDFPLDLQPKLLRALENKEIKPVGSDTCKKTDVRIIAATHKPLHKLVEEGLFREDLFYRLNVLQLNPPSLSERIEDFDDLFYTFAKQYRVRFEHNAIEQLKTYEWPGNIRELKNFVIKASVIYKGQSVNVEKVKYLMKSNKTFTNNILPPKAIETIKDKSLIKQTELDLICKSLVRHCGNQRKAAIELGLATSTLHDRIRKYSIDINKIKENTQQNITKINLEKFVR